MTTRTRWLCLAALFVCVLALPALADEPPPAAPAEGQTTTQVTPAPEPATKPQEPPAAQAAPAADVPRDTSTQLQPKQDPLARESGPRQTRSRPNYALLGVGAGATYIGYGLAVGSAAVYGAIVWPIYASVTKDSHFSSTMAWLFLPLVGPIFSAQTDSLKDERGLRNLMYVDSAVQAAGVGLIIAGLLVRHDVPVDPDDSRSTSGPVYMLGPGPNGSAGLTFMLALN